MLQPWKTEQNRGISTPPPPPPPWHSVFSKAIWRTERMLMWAESNLAYTLIPQQTYYAAVRVKGERLKGMGGLWCCRGLGACRWMMALSLIRTPAASDTHIRRHISMCKHSLRINPLTLCPFCFPCLVPVFTPFSRRCLMSSPDLSCGVTVFTQSAALSVMTEPQSMFDGDAMFNRSGTWASAVGLIAGHHESCRSLATCNQRVLKGCESYRPVGQMLNTLWLRGDRARDRATVRAWPQRKNWQKHTVPATENERVEVGEMILLF